VPEWYAIRREIQAEWPHRSPLRGPIVPRPLVRPAANSGVE
jgi:hypothetical protein